MPRVEAAGAVNDVWARTLASYKKDLSRKDLLVVEAITSPADVANHIEGLEAKTHAGKSGAFADRFHAITNRLIQFSNVIGAITSSNTEASLIWGSLKLLLTIVHQSSEEYEKICKSILAVSDSFPVVELVTETFNHSDLVCGHVVNFYTSVLKFWSKALKFYKRRRVFNILRAWHDFDSEFGDLDHDMKRYGESIEKAAAAVHMNESRTARLEQKAFNRELRDAKQSIEKSDRHRDIVSWLAPVNYEANYFSDDLKSASESRHPGTCTWILDRPEFRAWLSSDPNDAVARLLWLTGVPGAGKTVLSSFVISRCSEVSGEKTPPPILHFFFKLTDNDKNSVVAVTRSLLYQLYLLFPANMSTDIISLRDNSGKERALSEQGLWDLFVKHTKDLANLIIVLDALDECDGVDVLLRRVTSLLRCCRAKTFVVSRKEENIALELADHPIIVIGHEDVDADICSYVTAEIKRIPRFQGKSVQQRMIDALSSGHGGMFLWAYLMIKELKELGTVRQVDEALKSLPKGLEEMHERIITRLDSTLHKAHRELAIKILTWAVCAVRPLHLLELQEILRFETRQGSSAGQLPADDDVVLDDEDDLLYSVKDIELACGALVISRNETLQLIHLSTKEILIERPPNMRSDDSRLGFYVNTQRENPRMAGLCVSYISTHLEGIDSVTKPNLESVPRLQFSEESYDSTDLVTKSRFIHYASISWQVHLIDGKISLELEDVMCCLQTLLTYELTILWIELCVSLHQDILSTIERNCQEILLWADYVLVPAESSCHKAIGFLCAWSSAVVSIINEYGHFIEEYPSEIHYLDMESILKDDNAPDPAILSASFATVNGRDLREPISQVRAIEKHQPSAKIEPCRQLQSNLQDPSKNDRIGFVLYDSTRDVYLLGEEDVVNDTEVLRIQDRASGRRLLPVKSVMNTSVVDFDTSGSPSPSSRFHVKAASLCPAHTYLAILYGDYLGYFFTSIWVIERHIDFRNIRDRRPWARRLHCVASWNPLFVDSCLPLTAGQDGFFYCPSGQMHPERGINKRIPNCLVSTTETVRESSYTNLAFSGDGQLLIRLDRRIGLAEKVSWLENTLTMRVHSAVPAESGQPIPWRHHSNLRAISRTARFMVYQVINKNSPTAFYLLDAQGSQQQLQVDGHERYVYFYFSRDEQFLIGIYEFGQRNMTHFSRWAMTAPSFVPQAETSLSIPGFGGSQLMDGRIICVAEEDSQIILVNADRILYELDLSRLTFNNDTLGPSQSRNSSQQPYCRRQFRLSSDGHRLVASYTTCPQWSGYTASERRNETSKSQDLSKSRVELRFVDLAGTTDQMQQVELDYVDLEPATYHWHVVTFSPDLSMVLAGTYIFDLLAPDHPSLSLPDFLLNILRSQKEFRICFSSCNGYLVAMEGKIATAEVTPVTFGLFRICRSVGRVERMGMIGLEDMVAYGVSAAFHPMLPLLLLVCITRRANDIEDASAAVKPMEIDLQEHKPIQIAIPEYHIDPFEDWDWADDDIEAEYSSCGSFCFLMLSGFEALMLDSPCLGKRQAKLQIPAIWEPRTSYNGRFYGVFRGQKGTTVDLIQINERTHPNGLRDGSFRYSCTTKVKITALPSHLSFADLYLLVGKSADDLVRVLFLPETGRGPPEIKHLRVTMNQILARLEEVARTAEPNIRKRLQEGSYESSEEQSSVLESEESNEVESEEVAMSAIEGGGDSHESE